MEFSKETYSTIRQACENRSDIEFEVPLEYTAFTSSNAPHGWTEIRPVSLTPKGYSTIFIHLGPEAKDALTRLELLIYCDGGTVAYKKKDEKIISMKVSWGKL